MKMESKLSTVMFSQGWLDGQFENMIASTAEKQNEDPTAHLVATQMAEQWAVVSKAVDELIQENTELNRRMAIVRSALL